MTAPDNDPSIFNEPHLRAGPHRPDPSEATADRTLAGLPSDDARPDAKVETTVWDEPGISPELAGGVPEGEVTYVRWLRERSAGVTPGRTWLITFALALAAGPWAVLGAMTGSGQSIFSMLVIICIGPIVEETMKVSGALYVVEKRPFLFGSRLQILICAATAGLAFAAIENVLYLHVFLSNPSPGLTHWRWTVCVALHVVCSTIAGLGVARVWADVWRRWDRPRLALAFPYTLAAVLLHGAYNGVAVALQVADYRF